MTFKLASRMQHLKASEIREILKLTQQPDVISLAGGLPASECFPVEEIAEITAEVLAREGAQALQYSTTEGFAQLRQGIAGRMNRVLGTDVSEDEILVTSGAQQCLDLTGKVFLDEGDVVLCESPTYLGAINAFRAYGVRFLEVPTDDDGMLIPELESILAREKRVKIAYVVPDFQNPTGRCWSLDRRRAFLEVMAHFGVPVLEDYPYGELRFAGTALPPLKALDRHESVFFAGTFSKIYCPGLRLGWLAARREILSKYVLVKQGADLHTSSLAQLQVATFMERHGFGDAIASLRLLYRSRRDAMVDALEKELPSDTQFTRPQGGLFVWVELPGNLDSAELLRAAVQRKVAFVPGHAFFPNGGPRNTLRLNFSAMPPERITEGVARLGQVVRGLLEASPAPVVLSA